MSEEEQYWEKVYQNTTPEQQQEIEKHFRGVAEEGSMDLPHEFS